MGAIITLEELTPVYAKGDSLVVNQTGRQEPWQIDPQLHSRWNRRLTGIGWRWFFNWGSIALAISETVVKTVEFTFTSGDPDVTNTDNFSYTFDGELLSSKVVPYTDFGSRPGPDYGSQYHRSRAPFGGGLYCCEGIIYVPGESIKNHSWVYDGVSGSAATVTNSADWVTFAYDSTGETGMAGRLTDCLVSVGYQYPFPNYGNYDSTYFPMLPFGTSPTGVSGSGNFAGPSPEEFYDDTFLQILLAGTWSTTEAISGADTGTQTVSGGTYREFWTATRTLDLVIT